MQTPSTVQIRTAIEVLKKYGQHLNHHASNLAVELAEHLKQSMTPDALLPAPSNKPPALRPSPRSWSSGATN
jgi:hypothetical protein